MAKKDHFKVRRINFLIPKISTFCPNIIQTCKLILNPLNHFSNTIFNALSESAIKIDSFASGFFCTVQKTCLVKKMTKFVYKIPSKLATIIWISCENSLINVVYLKKRSKLLTKDN